MFFQKASDLVEEATVAEVTAVVEVIQDQPEAVVHQYAQVPERLEQALAEATVAVAPLVHHERAQRGQAARYDKNRPQGAVRGPVPLSPQET